MKGAKARREEAVCQLYFPRCLVSHRPWRTPPLHLVLTHQKKPLGNRTPWSKFSTAQAPTATTTAWVGGVRMLPGVSPIFRPARQNGIPCLTQEWTFYFQLTQVCLSPLLGPTSIPDTAHTTTCPTGKMSQGLSVGT